VTAALKHTRAYSEQEGLIYTVINEMDVPDELIARVRERLS